MDEAIGLYQLGVRCFGRLGGQKGGRLILSLFFKAILGIQRIFHFDTVKDLGFAWLTGGRSVLNRNTLGGLVRAVSTRAVGRFVHLTKPLLDAARQLSVSIDEHAVARFTRKFLIPKGFHTIRNKKMRIEKLFFAFDTGFRTLLELVVTPGCARLARISKSMLKVLRRQLPRGQMRVVLDAGAAQNHQELLELVDDNRGHVLLVRTPRRPAYRKRWLALPEASFTRYEEPGRYIHAPAKPIFVAETTTPLRASRHSPPRQVRTVVVREQKRSGKDRWHALFIFGDDSTPALALIQEFRARQHHEQTYRILLHDAFVDTVPSGYFGSGLLEIHFQRFRDPRWSGQPVEGEAELPQRQLSAPVGFRRVTPVSVAHTAALPRPACGSQIAPQVDHFSTAAEVICLRRPARPSWQSPRDGGSTLSCACQLSSSCMAALSAPSMRRDVLLKCSRRSVVL